MENRLGAQALVALLLFLDSILTLVVAALIVGPASYVFLLQDGLQNGELLLRGDTDTLEAHRTPPSPPEVKVSGI